MAQLRALLLFLLALGCAAPARGPAPASAPVAEAHALLRLSDLPSVKKAVQPAGRPLLVHFWALWCTACVAELPEQVSFAKKLAGAGVDVLFVDADGFDKEPAVRQHLLELGALPLGRQAMLNMELDVNDVTPLLAPQWGGTLPATFAIRADGHLGAKVIGPASPADAARLEDALSVHLAAEDAR